MSTSAWFVHHDTSIFPDPDVFKPERWQGEQAKELNKYLVPFSKGPRMCLGFNLGWAELRMVFAHIYRKFDLELADERQVLFSSSLPWCEKADAGLLQSADRAFVVARCLWAAFQQARLDSLDEASQGVNFRERAAPRSPNSSSLRAHY